jgi:DNA-binding NarL/FixJ family response regulator
MPENDPMIYISIVEDDDAIRESLALLIDGTPGYCCISTYGDCETAVKGIEKDSPDVVLMDIELPGMSGIEGVRILRGKMPDIDIIMLTVHKDDKLVFQSLCAGACGYLTKNTTPARLLEAIREVYDGGAPMTTNIARMIVTSFQITPHSQLTKRETEVLAQLCEGLSYKMIADELCISEKTVHFHIKNIYKKLQVHSSAEAVAKALKERLV